MEGQGLTRVGDPLHRRPARPPGRLVGRRDQGRRRRRLRLRRRAGRRAGGRGAGPPGGPPDRPRRVGAGRPHPVRRGAPVAARGLSTAPARPDGADPTGVRSVGVRGTRRPRM
ncbi:hypothetical protein E4P43_02825 [Blastococcus sp. TF02A-35]|nr:hypothetical protein E4P43_02825 [Blastococcus sp. TF02A_35]